MDQGQLPKKEAAASAAPGELFVVPKTKAQELEKPSRIAAEADLFRRAREVLGPRDAGGITAKLLKAKERNVSAARAVLEAADTKNDKKAYVMACINREVDQERESRAISNIF